jgi:hypothetical protein
MNVLRVPAGPLVGQVKSRLEELVLEGTLEPDREVLLAYLREHRVELAAAAASG